MTELESYNCSYCNINLLHTSAYLNQDGSMVCEKCAAPYIPTSEEQFSKIIPPEVVERLKCSECLEYLNCGPIYWSKTDQSICGRCVTFPPAEGTSRNTPYEALAELMLFPCKFKKYGCPESVAFSQEPMSNHEQNCTFRKETCPVMAQKCIWVGTHEEFLDHCQESHPDRIVQNPCSLKYDFSVSSVCTFLLNAFNNVFIFHTKVCIKSNNIYHIVQSGNPDRDILSEFNFTVCILRDKKMVKKVGEIAPIDRFNYSSSTFLITNIANLNKALEGLDNCVFTITVNKLTKPQLKCMKCKKKIDNYIYQEDGNWFCETCVPEKTTTCKNQNCYHKDLEKKCQKHELFFCPHGTWCWLCIKDIPRGHFLSHYNSKHLNPNQKIGSAFPAAKTGIYDKMILLPTNAGHAIIKYGFSEKNFSIQIRTSIPSQKLFEYHCVLKLMITEKIENAETFVLKTLYNEMHDWKLSIEISDKQKKWPDVISLIVDVQKGEKPILLGTENVVYQ